MNPLDQFRQSAREVLERVQSADWMLDRIEAAAVELVEQIIGEDEGLNAPLNHMVDGNPESDTNMELYIVRRATRNILRAYQRAALTKEEQHGE